MKPWQASLDKAPSKSKGGKEEEEEEQQQREKKTQPRSLSKLGACVKAQSGS
jgi:hypothetical protein